MESMKHMEVPQYFTDVHLAAEDNHLGVTVGITIGKQKGLASASLNRERGRKVFSRHFFQIFNFGGTCQTKSV